MKSKLFWILAVCLCVYLSLFSVQKINLLTADLGRHIMNGNLIIHSIQNIHTSDVIRTNLFSYTYPSFPFVNHHWLSGICAYIIFTLFGWNGLSLAYLFCLLGAFLLGLCIVRDDVSLVDICLGSLFIIPLIADRTEIRPEGVSYAFIMLYIFLLSSYSKNKIHRAVLWSIPATLVIWVNMHIYFIFGICIVGAFLCEALIREWREKTFTHSKHIGIILGASLIAILINPFGITLALYPLAIFKNYGYLIVENQSISFLENIHFTNPSFLWYKLTVAYILSSTVILLIYHWRRSSENTTSYTFPYALTALSSVFAFIAYMGIRSMTAFALVSLPLCIYNLHHLTSPISQRIDREARSVFAVIISIFIIIFSSFHFSNRLPWNSNFGIGLVPRALQSAEFIKQNTITGPFFNNYDIGSYFIFNFFPTEKVFVDNRPEAYPNTFFSDTYIPMQENTTRWKEVLAEENFNVIYFYRLDMTPWAQTFLLTRITDPDWAPVYVDDYTIIFLRRNEKNKKIIEQFELPKSLFGIQK